MVPIAHRVWSRLRYGYWVLLFRVAKSGLVVAKTIERFGLRWGWGGFTLLGLAVRQLTDSAGTTERRYWAFTGRPGLSGSWSSGRRGNPERANASADAPSGFLASRGFASLTPYFVLRTSDWVLLFRVAKSGLVVAKTMERFGLRWGWGGFTLLGLAVRQLTDSAGTTERRYWAFTGRPGLSGSWSSGRRGNPERANASADAPSGFLASGGFASLTPYFVLDTHRVAPAR